MLVNLKKFDVVYWKDNHKLVVINKIQLSTNKEPHNSVWRVDFVSKGKGTIPDINIRNYWYYLDGTAFDRQYSYADIVKVEKFTTEKQRFEI